MVRFIIVAACVIMSFMKVEAGEPKYPISAIPEELRANVNAVFREDHMVFKILSKSKGVYYVHQVISILNEKGKNYARESVDYDKLSKIKDFNGTVYDAAGKQIKKLKNSEIYDQSYHDASTLYSDDRFKAVDLSQGTYPYTVEFEYEVEFKYLFHVPGFVVVPDEKISVQHSSYTLEYVQGLAPRYKTYNINEKPVMAKTADGLESITWKFENVKPIKFEPLTKSDAVLAYISAAPSQFEYDTYSGSMNTWDEYGQWIISLNRGRNDLPESTKQTLKNLTASLKTTEEKTKAVYEYLQSKTRYVGIQLGIGGYQPFEASVVDQTGYGDCKALSNYTVSMLEAIGIKAHYVLIAAGENARPLQPDFPSTQFNHVVVAVPNGQDTLWLECTSQTNPFGYQGSFTGDRKALLITEQGARVVNTTRYAAEQNVQSRTAEVKVELNGDATAKIKTTYAGLQYENHDLNFYLNHQFDDQKKWVQNHTNIPSFDINSFSMKDNRGRIPSAVVSLDLNLRRYATVSGKRIFFTPNLMNKSSFIPEKVDGRKSNVVLKTTCTDLDTIKFQLPEGIYPEFLPEPVSLRSRFGEYESSFKVDQGNLVYIRRVKMNKGEFPPESYQEMIDFYKGMNKADNIKMVFMSKT